jgi:hypothetical protein
MEPQAGGAPKFELNLPPSPEGEQRQEHAAEAPPSRPEQAGKQPPKARPLPAIPDDIPATDQPVIAAPPQDAGMPITAAPTSTVADTDHIDKEWIDKVKNVVARTQEDPYLQKDQMSKIKADYIQKRFNKTIKTDEAAA